MFALKQLVSLALVGSALALPVVRRDGEPAYGYELVGDSVVPVDAQPDGTELAGYTVITVSGSTPTPAAAVNVVYTTITIGAGSAPTPTAAAAPAASSSSHHSSSSSSSSSSNTGTQSGGTGDYMSVVSAWRAKGGLPALNQDSTLEANALKTVQDGNGQMVHELNPGSMAQVLAPGNTGNFESVYVGGWLCEVPSLPGLDGICGSMTAGWSHDGETGHADILTNPSYVNIGCALANGIWGCDLS